LAVCCSGNVIRRISEVTLRQAQLVLGWWWMSHRACSV